MVLVCGLSTLYAHYGNSALLIALFSGLKPVVLAIIIFATFRVGQKSLVSTWHYLVALAAFLLSYFAGLPMPWIIVGVIAVGLLRYAILSKTSKIDAIPGPLVIVLAYVGFMAGFNHFHQSYSMAAIGLITTAYFTFLPNFALIFVGAPLIERTQKNTCIQFILSLVTASVVGVIVNLACYLGIGILFPSGVSSWYAIDPMALVWVLFSLFLLFKYKIGMLKLILLSLAYGFLLFLWRLNKMPMG